MIVMFDAALLPPIELVVFSASDVVEWDGWAVDAADDEFGSVAMALFGF